MSPFGNFIAFPLEIFRTGHNVIEQGIKEYTNNLPGQVGRELRKLGGRRLTSFGLTVGAVPLMVQETAKAIHNASSDEMEALRRIVPPRDIPTPNRGIESLLICLSLVSFSHNFLAETKTGQMSLLHFAEYVP